MKQRNGRAALLTTYRTHSWSFEVARLLLLSATMIMVSAVAPQQPSPGKGTSSGNADNGKILFSTYGCYECHGSHGQIVSRAGPALAPGLIPFDAFTAYVRHPAGSMPPYTDKVVSEQDLADIYAFLKLVPHPPDAKTIPLLNFDGSP